MSKIRSVIEGVGSYLPERVVTNEEMSTLVDTTDEWIRTRTGIHKRHMTDQDETTSDLAMHAAKQAMERANCSPDDIDLVIVGTTCPDRGFPATAAILQDKLGINQGAAFDVQAVCSGFIYSLAIADNFVTTGQYNKVLVVGAEQISAYLDWDDRTTAVLFGDGAGAVVLAAEEQPGTNQDRGVLSTYLRCDGRLNDLITTDGGPGSTGTVGKIQMQGREVFKYAVKNISEAILVALKDADLTVDDVDWFVPHQANKRILDGVAKKLGLPDEKVVLTIQDHGNTSAASVPLALNVAYTDGRIKPGDLVLFEAMGGGLTWGSALVRM